MGKKVTTTELVNLFIKKPNWANYEKIKNDYLGLSLLYQSHKLYPKEKLTIFLYDLTGDDWGNLHTHCFGEIKDWCLLEIATLSKSLEEWQEYHNYHWGHKHPELCSLAVKKITQCDEVFEKWQGAIERQEDFEATHNPQSFYTKERNIEALKEVLLQKAYNVAESFEELKFVFNKASGDLKNTAFVYMVDAI